MTPGRSRIMFLGELVRFTNWKRSWKSFSRPLRMLLCMEVLQCLRQERQWSPKRSIFMPHAQMGERHSGHNSKRSFLFSIVVKSSFLRRCVGLSLPMSKRAADIFGSRRSSSWSSDALSSLSSNSRMIFVRDAAAIRMRSRHVLIEDLVRKNSTLFSTCSLTHMSTVSSRYFAKIWNVWEEDERQSVYRLVMVVGSVMRGSVGPIQTPSVTYWRQRRVLSMKVGIAAERGCCIPSPPAFGDIEDIRRAWFGMKGRFVMEDMTLSIMAVNSVAMSLSHRFQFTGRSVMSALMMSAANR